MNVTRIHVAAAITMTCLGAAFAVGACGGSDGDGSKAKAGATAQSGNSAPRAEAQKFLDELDAAVRQGNIDVRVARLHPAVIERYGEQQCRDFLAGQPPDQTRRDRVKTVSKEQPFQYSDDGAPPVNTVVVHVKATVQSKKGDRNLHLARANGGLTYFIDCGNPLVRQ